MDGAGLVSEGATIGSNCRIGPYSVVGPEVCIGENTVVHPFAVVQGKTWIGKNCEVFPFSVTGTGPQDRKHGSGEESMLMIGDKCTIREHVTINSGTKLGGGVTRISPGCMLLAGCHVGHDCKLGEQVTLSNGVMLGGHVCIGEGSVVGGMSTVRQFVNIGKWSMVGGSSAVDRHVPPFGLVTGNRARLRGVNLVGLRRRGVPLGSIRLLEASFKVVFASAESRIFAERYAPFLTSSDPFLREVGRFLNCATNSATTVEASGFHDWSSRHRKIGICMF